VVLNTTTKLFFMNIKSSNHFCTHHLSVGFLVQLPTITCALSASCAPRTRVLGLESTDRALHSRSHFGVSADRQMHHRRGSAVALYCAARTAGSSCRRTVLTVESQPVVFRSVLSTTGVVTAPWSSLLLCVHKIFLFFDVGSFCAARGNFPSFTPTSSKHWSYRCTARPSSDPLGLRGIIFIHFAGGHPFSTAAVAAARCLVPAPSTDAKFFFRTCSTRQCRRLCRTRTLVGASRGTSTRPSL